MSSDLVLVADVGGTHSRFGTVRAGSTEPNEVEAFNNEDFGNLTEVAAHYLEKTGARPTRGVFAVAGPMKGGTVHLTNRRGWSFQPSAMAVELKMAHIDVINDFAALAWSLPHIPATDLLPIGAPGVQRGGTKLVLGPGTGLGVSALIEHDGMTTVVPSEGGHVGLAPTNEREAAVYATIKKLYGYVSAEMVVSGPGLSRLDRALAALEGQEIAERSGKEVSDAARAGEKRGAEAQDLFEAALARFAGDMALAFLALGGVYLYGGVAQKTVDMLETDLFRQRFENKPPHQKLLAGVGTVLITLPAPALLGCAARAARHRLRP